MSHFVVWVDAEDPSQVKEIMEFVPIVLVLQPVKIVGATNMPWFDISANEKDEKVWRDTVQHYLDDFPKNRWMVSLNCKE